jgi:SnoaL-like protein
MNETDRLIEIEAIKRLKYRYMRGIDEKRWDEIETCFVPEATCSYSGGKYSFEGRDAIMKFLTESMGRPTFLSSHRVHQPEIDVTSDTTATAIWALEDYVIDEQYGITIHGAAFYRDRYVKREGQWKILHTGYTRTFEQMQSRKERGWNVTQRGF